MKKLSRENFLENKYNRLMIAEILIVISFPFLQAINTRFPFVSMILLIAIIPALSVVLPLRAFLPLMTLGLIAFILEILLKYQVLNLVEKASLVILAMYAVFLLLAVIILIKKMLTQKIVTSDTIKGGISIYFLIGLLWAIFYEIASRINPDSFVSLGNKNINFFYYSYVTLTTLGYGDIIPTGDGVKLLAICEAFVGQVYLAIFVAQLVGLNIAQKLLKNQD